ncbi:MAG TPA: mechanosensitive ion channel family protein [Chitinophagales bacterium]|nr:mechanosensitive ion channel family protein [Chitinophagales bacterium]
MQNVITLAEVNQDLLSFGFWKDKLANIVFIIVILVITFFATRLAKYLFNRAIKRYSAESNIKATSYQFIRHFINATIVIIGMAVAIYAIPPLRTLSVSIFAGAGIIAAIFGFASQQAFSNIISGIFIVIFKPYRVNDRIEVGKNYSGIVEDITLRHTILRNAENKRIVIPNAVISNETIINATIEDERICRFVDIGISYDSDIEKAMRIMQEEALKHPLCIDGRSYSQMLNNAPVVDVKAIGFGETSVILRAYVWAKNADAAFEMGCDLNKSIKERFAKEGITMPVPYKTVLIK